MILNQKTTVLFLIFLTILVTEDTSAALSGPATDSDGNYTINWTMTCNGGGNTNYHLFENGVQISANWCGYSSGTKSITGKPAGTYNYMLDYCDEYYPEPGLLCASHFGLEEYHTVTVSTGGSGSGSTNSDIVRLGHYDADGRIDLFVESGISKPIVLRQLIDKTFQQVNLSSGQIQTYSNNWPTTSLVKVHHSDFNVDGTEDYALIGVDQVIPGANPQLIYSMDGGTVNTNPSHVTTLSESTQKFVGDALGLMLDYYHLYNRMLAEGAVNFYSYGYSWGYYGGAYLDLWGQGNANGPYIEDGENPYDDMVSPANCSIYACYYDGTQWQMYVYAQIIVPTWNTAIFHPSTLSLAQKMDQVDQGTATLDDLIEILEQILGAISCDGLDNSEIGVYDAVHTLEYFRVNTCSVIVIFRILNVVNTAPYVENGNEPSDPRLQFRARLVGAPWSRPASTAMHGSVHNPDNLLGWYSGFPQNGGVAAFLNQAGNLVKADTDISDSKQNTLLVGYIVSPYSPATAWTIASSAYQGYGNNLQYCIFPEIMQQVQAAATGNYCVGYNSNSFSKGLSNLLGIITPVGHRIAGLGGVSISYIQLTKERFPGITKPVPPSEF